jgi:hypothetical protein
MLWLSHQRMERTALLQQIQVERQCELDGLRLCRQRCHMDSQEGETLHEVRRPVSESILSRQISEPCPRLQAFSRHSRSRGCLTCLSDSQTGNTIAATANATYAKTANISLVVPRSASRSGCRSDRDLATCNYLRKAGHQRYCNHPGVTGEVTLQGIKEYTQSDKTLGKCTWFTLSQTGKANP